MVPPVEVLKESELELLDGAPWAASMHQLGLELANRGLGERVVVGVPAGSDRGHRGRSGQRIGIADSGVLAAAIGGDESDRGTAARASRARERPADDAPGVNVDDQGEVGEVGPGPQVGDVGDPELVRPARRLRILRPQACLLRQAEGRVSISATTFNVVEPLWSRMPDASVCVTRQVQPHGQRREKTLATEAAACRSQGRLIWHPVR